MAKSYFFIIFWLFDLLIAFLLCADSYLPIISGDTYFGHISLLLTNIRLFRHLF